MSTPPEVPAAGPWYSRARIGTWIESQPVQRAVMIVIFVNAAVLGAQTAPRLSGGAMSMLTWIDTICLAVFVAELLIKLYAFRWKFFTSAWNNFDFVVVAIALVPGSGFAVLRALRVLRVLRLISIVPALRRVVEALVRAIPGILSVGALLLIMFYVAAVLATNLFGEAFPEYFGSLGASLISVFQTMTMDNWTILYAEVSAVYPWAWAFFIPFILISAFAVLNLFIAVMVDAMKFFDPAPAGSDEPRTHLDVPAGHEPASHEPAGIAPSAEHATDPTESEVDADSPDVPLTVSDYRALLGEVRALRAELARFGTGNGPAT